MPADLKRVPDRKPLKVSADFDRPNREHLEILHGGVEIWNKWRKNNANIVPHLAYSRFRRVDFSGYNFDNALLPFSILSRCVFQNTTFRGADLRGASLRRADLTNANLDRAILRHVSLAECIVKAAVFSNCHIYGISAWNLTGEPKDQANMIMKADIEEAGITIDDIEVAQFIFLLLNNPKIRAVLESVTSKTVLILGRFTAERKAVLDALREELRRHNYVPVIFDFDKPVDKSIADTVTTLAKLARFVIADVTDAAWVTVEAQLIVRESRSIPFRIIKHESVPVPSPINDLRPDAPQLIEPFNYHSLDHVVASVKSIVEPAEAMAKQIQRKRKEIEENPW